MNPESIKQFFRFGTVGILNTAIDIGFFYILTNYAHLHYIFASTISFTLGIINSYIWNRIWTFKSSDRTITKEFLRFALVSVIGLVLNTLFLGMFVEFMGLPNLIGKIFATFLVLVWNFFMSKFWVFKSLPNKLNKNYEKNLR